MHSYQLEKLQSLLKAIFHPFLTLSFKIFERRCRSKGKQEFSLQKHKFPNPMHFFLCRRGKATAIDAPIFQCVSMLAIAVGPALTKYMHDLLELMFFSGLNEHLRLALNDLVIYLPPLLPSIQGLLMEPM